MKVYSPPTSLGDPPEFSDYRDESGRYDFKAHGEAEEAWVEKICEMARQNKCDVAGEKIYFGVGDGYAVYVVWDSYSLVHCPIGDNWSIPDAHARGLRLSDVRQMIKSEKAMNQLFGRA